MHGSSSDVVVHQSVCSKAVICHMPPRQPYEECMLCKGISLPANQSNQLWSYCTLHGLETHQEINTPDVDIIQNILSTNRPSFCFHFLHIQLCSMVFIHFPMMNGWYVTNVTLLKDSVKNSIVYADWRLIIFLKLEEVIVQECSSSHSTFDACSTVDCWLCSASLMEMECSPCTEV